MSEYTNVQPDQAPKFLAKPKGRRFLSILGLVKQAFLEAARQGIKQRFPKYAAPDALDVLAFDRGIDRGFALDLDGFRAQLRGAFTSWARAGSKEGVITALNVAGYATVVLLEDWDWNAGAEAGWWKFWVLLFAPLPVDGFDEPWLDSDAWTDGFPWLGGLPDAERSRLRRLVRKWKSAHSKCQRIYVIRSGELWDWPTGPWSDPGTWDANIVTIEDI